MSSVYFLYWFTLYQLSYNPICNISLIVDNLIIFYPPFKHFTLIYQDILTIFRNNIKHISFFCIFVKIILDNLYCMYYINNQSTMMLVKKRKGQIMKRNISMATSRSLCWFLLGVAIITIIMIQYV